MKAIKDAIGAFRSGEGLKGQLLRGGVGSVAVKIGSTLLNVLLAVVLARALGAEGFGVYSFVFALITILAIPAQMGLPNLVVRETAKAQAAGDWGLMKGLWRWSSLMALSMSAALMAIGGVAAWIFAANLPVGGLAVFYWGLVLVPLVALGNLRGAALRGLRHVVQGQLPEFILRPAFLIMLVLSTHFGLSARALTASDAMMLHAVASLVAFGIGAWLLVFKRPIELQRIAAKVGADKSFIWLGAAIPLGTVEAMHVINASIALIYLGLWGTADSVAQFRVALQGAIFVPFGLMALNLSVAPFIARLHAENRHEELRFIIRLTAWLGFLWGALVFLVLFPFGRFILDGLFGSEFVDAHSPMVILVIGQMVNVFVGPSGTVLPMMGDEKTMAKALVGTGALNILLAGPAVYYFGVIGAALATSFTIALYNIIVWRLVMKSRRIDTSIIGIRFRQDY